MKRILMIAIAAAGITASSAQTIHQRQIAEQRRIGQGVRSGQVTAGEALRLERNQASIQRQITRNRIDGGGLTLAERARIQAHQNQASNQIYRLKHNSRTR